MKYEIALVPKKISAKIGMVPKAVWTVGILFSFIGTGYGLIVDPIIQKDYQIPNSVFEIKVDPEINVVKAYQKSRFTKIPVEIAEVQAKIMVDAARKNNVPVELLVGMVEKESQFDAQAESKPDPKGLTAKGLMQIKGSTKYVVDQNKAYNLEYNLQTGINILKEKMVNNNGHMPGSLSDYSGGAVKYSDKVYEGVGRYVMFRNKMLAESSISDIKSFIHEDSQIAMVE